MAIDGRDIARQRLEREAGGPVGPPAGTNDAYESRGVRVISHLIIWIPVGIVVILAYWTGTWMGGPIMGVLSLVSTAATIGGLWLWSKARKRRH
jgi:hypothetical protein